MHVNRVPPHFLDALDPADLLSGRPIYRWQRWSLRHSCELQGYLQVVGPSPSPQMQLCDVLLSSGFPFWVTTLSASPPESCPQRRVLPERGRAIVEPHSPGIFPPWTSMAAAVIEHFTITKGFLGVSLMSDSPEGQEGHFTMRGKESPKT